MNYLYVKLEYLYVAENTQNKNIMLWEQLNFG